MSSFVIKAKEKATGEIKEVLCLDDYFGRRQYGYKVDDAVFSYEDFSRRFVEQKEEE